MAQRNNGLVKVVGRGKKSWIVGSVKVVKRGKIVECTKAETLLGLAGYVGLDANEKPGLLTGIE